MPWHSIKEAQNLTGKSRRTLYRDMAAGRLSWNPASDGGRELETSELLRVYGAFVDKRDCGTEEVAHGDTTFGTPEIALVLEELKALRAEVSELKATLLRLEHKPEQKDSAEPKPWWKRRPLLG